MSEQRYRDVFGDEVVLTDSVRLGLMAERDAEKAGRMILHDNAARMYGLKG